MNVIQINYDLITPGKDYARLFKYIKAHAWAKPLKSMWFIKTNKTATQVRDELKGFVDKNDKVVAVDVTDSWWGTNFSDSHTAWMKKNMLGPGARRRAA